MAGAAKTHHESAENCIFSTTTTSFVIAHVIMYECTPQLKCRRVYLRWVHTRDSIVPYWTYHSTDSVVDGLLLHLHQVQFFRLFGDIPAEDQECTWLFVDNILWPSDNLYYFANTQIQCYLKFCAIVKRRKTVSKLQVIISVWRDNKLGRNCYTPEQFN